MPDVGQWDGWSTIRDSLTDSHISSLQLPYAISVLCVYEAISFPEFLNATLEMDGISIAKKQELIGVRAVVEDIDSLRMMLGFDYVKMLTPKVEVRLRSAAKAHIPLKLSCTISTHSDPLQAVITFPGTYPADNLLIEVTDQTGVIADEMTSKLQEFCACSWFQLSSQKEMLQMYLDSRVSEVEHSTDYPRAVDAINYLKQLLLLTDTVAATSEITVDNLSISIEERLPSHDPLVTYTADEEQEVPEESSLMETEQTEDDKYYSCMVCGYYLFQDHQIEKHYPTQKDADRRGGKILPCSSVFTSSPPSFMDETKILENTVKIACPKCQGKLGLICWTGSQCSCGAWITPAFQYINSKVDLKRKNFDILSFTNLKSSQPKLRN